MTAPGSPGSPDTARPTVLITGAAGSIGRKLRRHLDGRYELRLVDLHPGDDPAVAAADLSRPDEGWMRLFDGADIVLHCAAASRVGARWRQVVRHNIEATINVLEAATNNGARRVILMSSSWTMAGYRFGTERLTTDLPTRPINPYGVSKVVGERLGHGYSVHHGLSVICLRIGACPVENGSRPRPRARHGLWEQGLWISNRDLCQLVERSITAPHISFAIVNGMSDNPGMRWDLTETRRLLGYEPVDARMAELSVAARLREAAARIAFRLRHLLR